MEKLYNTKDVAEALGVSVDTVYDYVKHGELKATRIGRLLRFRIEDVKEFIGFPKVESVA